MAVGEPTAAPRSFALRSGSTLSHLGLPDPPPLLEPHLDGLDRLEVRQGVGRKSQEARFIAGLERSDPTLREGQLRGGNAPHPQ